MNQGVRAAGRRSGRRRNKLSLTLLLLSRRLRHIGPTYFGVFAAAALLIHAAERDAPSSRLNSWGDTVWYLVVTISTVGYGDIYPVTNAGRWVAGAFILFTLVTIGVLLAAFNDTILEVKRMEDAGLIGTQMRGHVILCGAGSLARAALQELLAAGCQVAVVCDRPEEVAVVRQLGPASRLFVTSGEATQELLRDRVNAVAARTCVIALEDDARTLVASLNMRAVGPAARIIVALNREELRSTFVASGVTYVASPHELSGRLLASAAFEPDVAHFVEDVTSGTDGGHDLQQYCVEAFAGLSVREVRARLEEADGPLLVGVARYEDGRYLLQVHPPRDLRLGPRDHIIVLASEAQARQLRARFGVDQGR